MILKWFKDTNPIIQALIAKCFTWLLTFLGVGLAFFFITINRKELDAMLGFAAGIMIVASYWSLLAPAIEMSENAGIADIFVKAQKITEKCPFCLFQKAYVEIKDENY